MEYVPTLHTYMSWCVFRNITDWQMTLFIPEGKLEHQIVIKWGWELGRTRRQTVLSRHRLQIANWQSLLPTIGTCAGISPPSKQVVSQIWLWLRHRSSGTDERARNRLGRWNWLTSVRPEGSGAGGSEPGIQPYSQLMFAPNVLHFSF